MGPCMVFGVVGVLHQRLDVPQGSLCTSVHLCILCLARLDWLLGKCSLSVPKRKCGNVRRKLM